MWNVRLQLSEICQQTAQNHRMSCNGNMRMAAGSNIQQNPDRPVPDFSFTFASFKTGINKRLLQIPPAAELFRIRGNNFLSQHAICHAMVGLNQIIRYP